MSCAQFPQASVLITLDLILASMGFFVGSFLSALSFLQNVEEGDSSIGLIKKIVLL